MNPENKIGRPPLPSGESAAGQAVGSSDLLACPFCGAIPKICEMRYINTGRLYGYRLKCGTCGLGVKEQPVCWPAGKENEEMLEAKVALVKRWNTRAG